MREKLTSGTKPGSKFNDFASAANVCSCIIVTYGQEAEGNETWLKCYRSSLDSLLEFGMSKFKLMLKSLTHATDGDRIRDCQVATIT